MDLVVSQLAAALKAKGPFLALADGEDINKLDASKKTRLHLAAAEGNKEACLALLDDAGFTGVNALDGMGATALHYASYEGFE